MLVLQRNGKTKQKRKEPMTKLNYPSLFTLAIALWMSVCVCLCALYVWLVVWHFRKPHIIKIIRIILWTRERKKTKHTSKKSVKKAAKRKNEREKCEFDAQVVSVSANIIRVRFFFSLPCPHVCVCASSKCWAPHDVNDEYALIFYSLVIAILLQLKQGKPKICEMDLVPLRFFCIISYFMLTFFSLSRSSTSFKPNSLTATMKRKKKANCSELRCTFRYLSCGKLHSEFEESWHICFAMHKNAPTTSTLKTVWQKTDCSFKLAKQSTFERFFLTYTLHKTFTHSLVKAVFKMVLHRWHVKMQKKIRGSLKRCHTNEGNFSEFAECKHCLRSFICARRLSRCQNVTFAQTIFLSYTHTHTPQSLCTNILHSTLFVYRFVRRACVYVCVIRRMYKR